MKIVLCGGRLERFSLDMMHVLANLPYIIQNFENRPVS